ncbi:MAG: tyrosine-type recombinase/integrase [Lachnospiraceae bacterium]|nr:tyrosine-type recombinase/integrase [Lachnospiraceae bacterium]
MKCFKRSNGSGSVYKLSGNRRRPYVAVITTDWNGEKQQRKLLGTFSEYDEAILVLADYQKSSAVSSSTILFRDVYEQWSIRYFPELSQSSCAVYRAAFNNSKDIHDTPFANINVDTLEKCICSADVGYESARSMKKLYSRMFKYAVPRGFAIANQAQYIDIHSLPLKSKKPLERRAFTDKEIYQLFEDAIRSDFCKVVCMLIYSGLRISEMLNLKKCDCHIDERWIYVSISKTTAGIRQVPIADKTLSFWKYFFYRKQDCDYLLYFDGRCYNGRRGYDAFYGKRNSPWRTYFSSFDITHTVHETRHSCETMLRRAEVYPTKIDAILGHSGSSLGERVYTHLTITDLIPEINKI